MPEGERATIASLQAKLAAAEAVIRRLDWSNIHTHYGFTNTCEDCNYYAMLRQSQQANYRRSTDDA